MNARERPRSSHGSDRGPFIPRLPTAVLILLISGFYFVAGKASLRLAFVHPSATAVWLPTGATLAAFLFLGYRIWPGIFAGAFLVNLTTAGSVATSIGIATGNTFEGLAGAYLVNRFARGIKAFDHTQDAFKFALCGGALSTMVSATLGVSSLILGNFAQGASFSSIWLTWWMGNVASNLVVAPLLLLWGRGSRLRWSRRKVVEAALFFLFVVAAGAAVFGGVVPSLGSHYAFEFLALPLVVWAAFRLGQREAALATFLLAGIAIWGTLKGRGPLAIGTPNESLLLLDVFIAMLALMGLVLATATRERDGAMGGFALMVEHAPNAIVAVDRKGKIALVNSQAEVTFGYRGSELIGRSIEVLVPGRFRRAHAEHRMDFSGSLQSRPMGMGRDLYAIRKDGTEFPVEVGLSPIETEQGELILSAIVDITVRKLAEEEIQRQAALDPLTGLVNYRRLIEVFGKEAERTGRTGRSVSLLLLDLDGLKKINDTHGHLVGSRALCRVALVLRQQCRVNDTPARHGGDEFVVVLPDADAESACKLARRVGEQLARDREQPPLSFSYGAAALPKDGSTFEQVMEKADRALYEMKRSDLRKAATSRD